MPYLLSSDEEFDGVKEAEAEAAEAKVEWWKEIGHALCIAIDPRGGQNTTENGAVNIQIASKS